MVAVKRILVPVDFGETSHAALNYAMALARTFGAELHFLYVSDRAYTELGTEFPLGLEGAVEDGIRERLLKILTPREQAEFRPEFAVRPGAPAGEITRYAQENAIDLIVMGTHGRGVVGHAVLGSVAEKVVRTASCPVLTLRSQMEERLQPEAAPVRAQA